MSASLGLWAWAVAAYGRPGVADACQTLQDEHSQSVPFLLWAAWCALEGRPLSQDRLEEGAVQSMRWEEAAVAPLRAARRRLKISQRGIGDAEREALRTRVKALELEAEQMLMTCLESLAPPADGAAPPLLAALAAASAAWGSPASEAALSPLAGTLS